MYEIRDAPNKKRCPCHKGKCIDKVCTKSAHCEEYLSYLKYLDKLKRQRKCR